jgi:HEAT repeat protein
VKLLDTPETALDAAEALGRMGSAARPAVKPLTRMLKSEAVTERWAAVRAISQIGGEDAAPAVEFMIRELRNGVEVDCYNMMIYLALLGPVAKDAIPAIQSARLKNPILKPATIWAIEPDKRFPWLNAGGFGMPFGEADFARYIYESYVQELGDRLKPAASALARKIMDGSAGDVPPWGYKLLAHFPAESLAILTPGLTDKELKVRQRVTVALGYMGPAAAAAKPQLTEAITNAPNEKEKRLLKWSLREIEAIPAAIGS